MILKQSNRRQADRLGFTLMEVLVVVAILVVLAGTASVFVFRYLDDAKKSRVKADLKAISTACEAYKLQFDEFPPTLQDLVSPPDGRKPFLDANSLKDPWERLYQYDPNGTNNGGLKPDVFTTIPDTNEQIGNWMSAGQQNR